MLHVQDGPIPREKRFGVWIQARQHAWECGSSWVAQGFAEWIDGLIEENRMDVFIDLHNPAPGDPTFFYILDDSFLREPMTGLLNRFIDIAYSRISAIKPVIPMSNKPKTTGPDYHQLWRQISADWVCMHGNAKTVGVCLETIWNSNRSTTEGYRAVGANVAGTVS